jgi:hypothetical protein
MSYSDDDLGRELRRELQGNLVPFDPARAQYMIDEAIAASPVRRVLQSRWTLPLLASGAVAAVVGGGAAAAVALHPDGKTHPGGGPTVTVSRSPLPTVTVSRSPLPTVMPTPVSSAPTRMPSPPPTTSTVPSPASSAPTGMPSRPVTSVATTVPEAPPSGLTPIPGRG